MRAHFGDALLTDKPSVTRVSAMRDEHMCGAVDAEARLVYMCEPPDAVFIFNLGSNIYVIYRGSIQRGCFSLHHTPSPGWPWIYLQLFLPLNPEFIILAWIGGICSV